ncbi:hypothetical protein QJS10_CPA03g01981 [Acorus calamus]|uniref:Uncharacterized protein n=1 Tax=Acorus calamus TaxID=4465 RepID=A0AAV9FDU9_ACOCL|nr:hypothetical protein QJS10_CPA03g01981 [Acorus calamus]
MDALRHRMLSISNSVVVFNLFPKLSKIAFRGRWRSLLDLRRELDDLLIPLGPLTIWDVNRVEKSK